MRGQGRLSSLAHLNCLPRVAGVLLIVQGDELIVVDLPEKECNTGIAIMCHVTGHPTSYD